MRRGHEPDPAQEGRQSRANELMLRVGLLLLADARREDGFATDPAELARRLAQIEAELGGARVILGADESTPHPDAEYVVEVTAPKADRIGLACRYGSQSVFTELRRDGVLENGGVGIGFSLVDSEQAVPLSPVEEEVMRKAGPTFAEERERGRADFQGAELTRVLAPEPQPSAVVRILAVELYGDGLIVGYQYDDPVDVTPKVPLSFYERAGVEPPIDELLEEARKAGGNLAPGIAVADDLGTTYREAGEQSRGVQAVHGTVQFTPAVPAGASSLSISTYAGVVTVEL